MKRFVIALLLVFPVRDLYGWGFYAHQKINYYAVFLLPPEMMLLFKPNIDFLSAHAVDPDKRRYAVPEEAPRHYIDMDHYGVAPYVLLPRRWKDATQKYSEDSLNAHGIVPWWLQTMMMRLTEAFKAMDKSHILKYAAELGHYMADAHVPLHTSSNHNGQFTDQKGIHGFWESRVPELLAESKWDLYLGKAEYISDLPRFIWKKVMESAAAADSVLKFEKELSNGFPPDQKYSYEFRNGIIVKQYSKAYTIAYDKMLKGMIERRMRASIFAVASCWYTAWINAGQPYLGKLNNDLADDKEKKEFEQLDQAWKLGRILGREE
jgi:hypothetical protein